MGRFPRLPADPDDSPRGPQKRRQRKVVPFVAGRSHLLDDLRKQKGRLPEIVRVLQHRVDNDWSDCTVVVTSNDQDLVQAR